MIFCKSPLLISLWSFSPGEVLSDTVRQVFYTSFFHLFSFFFLFLLFVMDYACFTAFFIFSLSLFLVVISLYFYRLPPYPSFSHTPPSPIHPFSSFFCLSSLSSLLYFSPSLLPFTFPPPLLSLILSPSFFSLSPLLPPSLFLTLPLFLLSPLYPLSHPSYLSPPTHLPIPTHALPSLQSNKAQGHHHTSCHSSSAAITMPQQMAPNPPPPSGSLPVSLDYAEKTSFLPSSFLGLVLTPLLFPLPIRRVDSCARNLAGCDVNV